MSSIKVNLQLQHSELVLNLVRDALLDAKWFRYWFVPPLCKENMSHGNFSLVVWPCRYCLFLTAWSIHHPLFKFYHPSTQQQWVYSCSSFGIFRNCSFSFLATKLINSTSAVNCVPYLGVVCTSLCVHANLWWAVLAEDGLSSPELAGTAFPMVKRWWWRVRSRAGSTEQI